MFNQYDEVSSTVILLGLFIKRVAIPGVKMYAIINIWRLHLSWFLQLQFYSRPLSFLSSISDPFMRAFRGVLPVMFGLDFSPILAFLFLDQVLSFLQQIESHYGL